MNERFVVRVVGLGLMGCWMGAQCLAQQSGASEDRPILPRPGAAGRVEQPPARMPLTADLEARIEKLKAEHKALVDELRAIADLAAKEKAKQTAARIRQFLDKQREAYETQLAELEKRLNRFKSAMSETERREKMENRAGTTAPLFSLKGPDGKTVNLTDYKGKLVVLEWADPECPFWRYYTEKRILADLAAKYKDKAVTWLAMSSGAGTTTESNKKTVDQFRLPYPILNDGSGQTARNYGATITPQMFVIDRRGLIVYSGAIDNAPFGQVQGGGAPVNYVDKALTEVLEGKAVATPRTKANGSAIRFGSPNQMGR